MKKFCFWFLFGIIGVMVCGIALAAAATVAQKKDQIAPNESGKIPILEYHHISGNTGRWNRSAQQFKDDLLWLYNNGYVSMSLQNFALSHFDLPSGKKPVIFTFDDGLIDQFQYLSNGSIDPKSAVGIMDSFYQQHPDFGRAATFFVNESVFGQPKFVKKKLEYLHKTGREIGFHTLKHTNLRKQSPAQVRKILLDQARSLQSLLPEGMKLRALAYPFGGVPKVGIHSIKSAQETGAGYDIQLALLVGAEPAYPLYHAGADAFRVPRIQAIDTEWLRHFGRKAGAIDVQTHPEKFNVFVGNGDIKNNPRADNFPIKLSVDFFMPFLQRLIAKKTGPFKGIYLTAYTAGSKSVEKMLEKFKASGGNLLVVDFKEVDGHLYYPTAIELNRKLGGNNRILFADPKKFVDFAHQQGFYVVARIVCFKDKLMAGKKPEWAIHDFKGRIWQNPAGQSWLDPSLQEAQDYILSVAKEAAGFGVDEIQFDYVRFPTEGAVKLARYNFDQTKIEHFEIIRNFLKKARETPELTGVSLGIDVYGIVAWHNEYDAVYTGQKIGELAKYVDVIYPMIYPSHFGPGFGGHKNPADEPYFFVKESLRLFQDLLVENDNVELRPWLQGFTYRVSRFGPDYIKKQIEAVYDSGLDSYAVWNAGNRYDATFAGMQVVNQE